MDIILTEEQKRELVPLHERAHIEAGDDYMNRAVTGIDTRGVVVAQVYPTYMKVNFVSHEFAVRMIDILLESEKADGLMGGPK